MKTTIPVGAFKYVVRCAFIMAFIVCTPGLSAQDADLLKKEYELLCEKNSFAKAAAIADKLIALCPDSVEYKIDKTHALFSAGEIETGFKILNENMQIHPNESRMYFQRAYWLMNFGEASKAMQDLNTALGLTTNPKQLKSIYSSRSLCKTMKQDNKGALEDSWKAFGYDSTDVIVLMNLGLNLSRNDQHDPAIRMIRKVTAMEPRFAGAWINQGFICSEAGRYEEAVSALDKAVELNPKSAYALNNRGYAKHKAGDTKGGLKDIKQSLKYDKENAYAYRNMALVQLDSGNLKDACEACLAAIDKGFERSYGDEMIVFYRKNCK